MKKNQNKAQNTKKEKGEIKIMAIRKPFKIAIIGSGHVGLVSGAVFAQMGSKVICVDNDKKKIEMLKEGKMPFYEPGLEEIIKKNKSRLTFTDSISYAVKNSDIIFICVGTPPKENGEPDLRYVENVAREIGRAMDRYKLIVEKSTVPVQTGEWIEKTINLYNVNKVKFDVASSPEFLREGSAIKDAMKPDRIVIGTQTEKAKKILLELFKPFKAPIITCDIRTAEIIKHSANAFLSMKISFINAVGNICERIGADVDKVAEGIGLDKRIGREFLQAGIGYGGFCFPKDLRAYIRIAEKVNYDFELLKVVEKINNEQRLRFVDKIKNALWNISGKKIGVLGLSFKPNTDDMRFAPSVEIISLLQKEGAEIKAYDPKANEKAKDILQNVTFCKNAYETAKGSDCLVIITEWDEFKKMNLAKIKKLLNTPIIIDGRNIFSPEKMKKLGFRYICMGK